MKKGLVSVIMPCYNGEDYINAAVDSALGQSYGNIEVLVIDDGSSDGSLERLHAYKDDPRFRLLRHDHNCGIPAARNTGISAAMGEYIAFLDQDDIWEPFKLEKQMQVFEKDKGEKGLVFAEVDYLYDVDYEPIRNQREMVPPGVNSMPRQEVQRRLFMCNFIPSITVVIPKRVIDEVGGFDEEVIGGSEDHELFLRVAGHYDLHYIAERIAVKRLHIANYSLAPRLKRDQLYITEKMVDMFPELLGLRKIRLSGIYEALGYYYCGEGEFRTAVWFYMRAVREAPADIANWSKLLGAVVGLVAGRKAQVAYFKAGRRAQEKACKLWRRQDEGISARMENRQ